MLCEVAAVETAAMHGGVEAEPGRDVALLGRPAETEPGHRHDLLGQAQQVAHHRGVIADGADRAAAEPGGLGGADEGRQHDRRIGHRVEKQIEVIVREWLVAHLGDRRHAGAVGDEHQERRRVRDPRHVGDGGRDRALHGLVVDDDDVALLQIALGRRRQRAGAQEPQRVGRNRLRKETAVAAMARHGGKFGKAEKVGIDRNALAEAFGERVLQ